MSDADSNLAARALVLEKEQKSIDGISTQSEMFARGLALRNRSPEEQGLILDFAFNHAESARSFRAAQKLDPECAMCYWGEALALGPNINVTSNGKAVMSEKDQHDAYAAIQKALSLKANASEKEAAFIDALATRYNGDPASLTTFDKTVEYLPFTSGSTDKTLVIGAGGGKDILMALHAGSQAITAVEVNPAVVSATRHFADYNGDVLDLPAIRPALQAEHFDNRFAIDRSVNVWKQLAGSAFFVAQLARQPVGVNAQEQHFDFVGIELVRRSRHLFAVGAVDEAFGFE